MFLWTPTLAFRIWSSLRFKSCSKSSGVILKKSYSVLLISKHVCLHPEEHFFHSLCKHKHYFFTSQAIFCYLKHLCAFQFPSLSISCYFGSHPAVGKQILGLIKFFFFTLHCQIFSLCTDAQFHLNLNVNL